MTAKQKREYKLANALRAQKGGLYAGSACKDKATQERVDRWTKRCKEAK